MTERLRGAAALTGWTAFVVGVLVALHALGGGPLSAPPLRGFGTWLGRRDAATAVFALVRLALVGVAWYLLVSTVLAIALRVLRADAAAGAVEACTPAPVRRLVRAAAGLSIAASVVAVSAAAASEGDDPVTMRRLPDAEMRVVDDIVADAHAPVTMTRLADAAPTSPPTSPPPSPRTWTVKPGEHLWSIAERSLGDAWQRTPSDDEIDPYWRRLVEHNRHRLADPANPDLIHPGLEIDLPDR